MTGFHWKMTDFGIDALISFTSTTIDDFAVMLYFFSLAEMKMANERSRQYVSILVSFFIGYTIVGFTALVSLLFGLVLSKEYIALAGFVPLLAGIHKVYESLVEKDVISPFACCGSPADDESNKRGDDRVYNPITTEDDDTLDNDDLEAAGGVVQMKSLSLSRSGGKQREECNSNTKRSSNAAAAAAAASSDKSTHGSGSAEKRHNKVDKDGANDKFQLNTKQGNSGTGSKINSNRSSHKTVSAVDDEGDDSDWSSDDEYDICGPVQESIDSTEDKILGMFSAEQFRRHYRDPINWEVLMITLASGSDHVVIYVRDDDGCVDVVIYCLAACRVNERVLCAFESLGIHLTFLLPLRHSVTPNIILLNSTECLDGT